MILEQYVLFGEITAGVLFLGFAYFGSMKGFWNQNKPKFRVVESLVVVDIWRERSSTDFLRYLKFEFVQFLHFCSYIFTSLLVMPICNRFMIYPVYVSN